MTSSKISIDIVRLSVEIAELRVQAEFMDNPGRTTELRGRLMGPRCPGVTTIEIAYPVKGLSSDLSNVRLAKVLIPEPNLWTAAKPFTYWGYVEIWQEGQLVSSNPVEVGLRQTTS